MVLAMLSRVNTVSLLHSSTYGTQPWAQTARTCGLVKHIAWAFPPQVGNAAVIIWQFICMAGFINSRIDKMGVQASNSVILLFSSILGIFNCSKSTSYI